MDIKLSTEALELAKAIAHEVWDKYDDTYGYRTEKQTWSDAISTNHPDNIWSIWNQFDSTNQAEFAAHVALLVNSEPDNVAAELLHWIYDNRGL